MNKQLRKGLALLLVLALTMSLTTVVVAQEERSLREAPESPARYESLPTVWDPLPALTEKEFWAEMDRETKDSVAYRTCVLRVAQIERELDGFFSNLSVETLFEELLREHPSAPENKLLSKAQEIATLLESEATLKILKRCC